MALSASAPDSLLAHLEAHSRQESVLDHEVLVNVSWWNEHDEPLQGGPVVIAGETAGKHAISRADLFEMGDQAVNDESGAAALRLLWHTLAWGTGTKHRNNKQRINSVSSDEEATMILLEAARTSRTDPEAAFNLMRAKRRNRFASLGPNFSTKFLYFAGGGDPEHLSLIVDQFVRATLLRETGDVRFEHVSQYSVSRYLVTLEQLKMWARDAQARLGRPIAGDEVEYWAFASSR